MQDTVTRRTPTFSKVRKIRFGHTDPAGIVYYPHYFDMFNAIVEDFFDECVGASFQEMIRTDQVVTPLRHVECDFSAPSRIGDRLLLALTLLAVGRRSITVELEGSAEGNLRLRARLVIVFVSTATGQAVAPPARIAERLAVLGAGA